jgi:2-polyprenyl-3-methyl-5-hydroxy-6-metoxy-1,4-benzoquinol methylase
MPYDAAAISWSQMYAWRRAAARRFGKSVFALPVVTRLRHLLLRAVRDGSSVLEVGAGQRKVAQFLARWRPAVEYQSQDIDPLSHHDYRNLDEITRVYDCVLALEVIEHLPLEAICPWLARLAELLRPGGRLVVSTPNTYYPPAWLRDATHRTPLCFDELAGLVAAAGLDVEQIVRVDHEPWHRHVLRRYVFGWLFRLIGIDFARQIVIVARKAGA